MGGAAATTSTAGAQGSTLPQAQPAAAPPLPAGGEWLTLAEAAKRSGRTEGHLRRSCRAWAALGLARQARRGKGRAGWEVRADADPAFARVKFADQLGLDLRHLTEAQRRTVLLRKRVLDAWDQACAAAVKLGYARDAGTGRFLENLLLGKADGLAGVTLRVSRPTLYNWLAAYRAGGLAALADGRAGKPKAAAAGDAADPFMAEVRRFYLSPRKPKLTVCHQMALLTAQERGWAARSYKACQRMVERIDPRVVLKMRFGEEAYVNHAEPFVERDYTTLASNDVWSGDHHQFDVIVRHGDQLLRPWLTVWMDVRSRMVAGWEIAATDPNTDRILAALRNGILAHGVPRTCQHDNGKDYDSFALHGRTKRDRWARQRVKLPLEEARAGGVFAALQIEPQFVWPYHGQSKPVERFFGTVERDTVVWETYCGNSPANKPQDLQLMLERGKAPTLAEFRDWFAAWLDAYHATAHQGQGMDGRSPAAVWAACLEAKRTAPAELLDVLLLPTTPPLKVGQNGVTWKGLRYGQHEPALRPLIGSDVVLRVDPADVSRVQVWTPEGRFVCVAPANAKVPFQATAEQLRSALADKRADRKALAAFHDRRPRMAEDLADKLVRAKAAAARAQAMDAGLDPDQPPPSIVPVQSPFADQLPALQRALEVQPARLAAGAEGAGVVSLSDVFSPRGGDDGQAETSDPFSAFRDAFGRGDGSDE